MRAEDASSESQERAGVFATTHWSVVLAAGQEDTPQSTAALEKLCRIYWYPLYSYARRRGYSPEDAQDLTQGFFARLLARHSLESVRPEHGRFRCFVLTALKRFMVNDQEHASAAKRGRANVHIPFDTLEAEERYSLEAVAQHTPDKLFDRAWAVRIMETALAGLQEEYRLEGKYKQFQTLKQYLGRGEKEMTYAAAGLELGLSEGAVKVAVHRMRRRYRDLLREQVAQTVSTAANLEDELQSLKKAFYE